jgi:VanZ family protein
VHFLPYVTLEMLALMVVPALVAALAAATPGLRARDRGRAVRAASRVLLAGALVAVLAVTLQGGTQGGLNLVPLRGITQQLTNLNPRVGALNLVGNALMFAPLGFLAPLALGWPVRRTLEAAVALSIAIEVTQLAIGRSADVDDLILNSLGAAAGVALAAWVIHWTAASDVMRSGGSLARRVS